MTHQELALTAAKARLLGLDMVYHAASGHLGGSFSAMDVLTVLYQNVLRIDPANLADPNRDRFVLSKGHCTPALYPTLALRGFFPLEDLQLFRSIRGHMSGHAEMHHVPGVDMSTGSLGQGISAACGMALGAKVKGLDQVRVYAVMGDGEIEEGECWEAFMFASHYKLDNLCVFLDLNHLQIDGPIEKVMNSAPQDKKLEAFGFKVLSIDGHDLDQIEAAVETFHAEKGRPTFIILNTTKGKGVSYMENNANWHGKAPGDADYHTAMDELNAALAQLEKEEG